MEWEYIIEDIDVHSEGIHELNSYGADGWELVTALSIPNEEGNKFRYIFKKKRNGIEY